MTQHTLRAGELELMVDAARGGSIMAFRDRGFDLMRPWDGVSDDPRSFASFPLVPFSGRVDHARFRFGGTTYDLAANFPPEPHAIHGDGWTSPWELVAATATSAELELVHDGPGDVLRYRATQIFWLYPDRLEIAMSVTNRGPEPMPFGLGHHPYFGDRDQARLSAEVGGVWLPDDLNLPQPAGAGAGAVGLPPAPAGGRAGARPRVPGLERQGADRLARGRSRARDHGRRALPPPRRLRAARPALLLRRAGQHDRRRLQPAGRRRRGHRRARARTPANRCAAA